MKQGTSYYIAGCVFTSRYPVLSGRIQAYIRSRYAMPIVRCCVPAYRIQDFESQMPTGAYRQAWQALPDCAPFTTGDTVYSICHNCSAIIEETKPNVTLHSLWELLCTDSTFPYPSYAGLTMTLQDCWRATGHHAEHAAVRQLLDRMNITITELPNRGDAVEFCGNSLLRPSPPRNLKLAPNRFVRHGQGKFLPHTLDEQRRAMETYVATLPDQPVVAYCHYCAEGLTLGGATAFHLGELLFMPDKVREVLAARPL